MDTYWQDFVKSSYKFSFERFLYWLGAILLMPVLISEAFDAVSRQLRKLMEKQQRRQKTHPQQERIAFVIRLFADEGYGFIKTLEGRELYFHRNSVLNDDFDRLEIGTGVRYVPGAGDKGPKASTLQIVDKPGVSAIEPD